MLVCLAVDSYKKYVMLDPRGVVTKMREAGTDEAFGPADAPTTIALGEESIDQKQETYIYRPDLGEVPMISVPDTLPDLLGMAGIICCFVWCLLLIVMLAEV